MSPAEEPIRVLLVDDHLVVREGLKALIGMRDRMIVVGEAADGEEAVRRHRELGPDVTLMDLRMPRLSGVEAIRAIRRDSPNARIIVLTTFTTDEDVYKAIQAGALSYLLKESTQTELLDTIRAAHRGQRRIPPELAARLAEHALEVPLTDREMDVLRLMARGQRNKEIAQTLSLSEGTVKGHVNNLFHKLGVDGRTEAVAVAVKRGLIQME